MNHPCSSPAEDFLHTNRYVGAGSPAKPVTPVSPLYPFKSLRLAPLSVGLFVPMSATSSISVYFGKILAAHPATVAAR